MAKLLAEIIPALVKLPNAVVKTGMVVALVVLGYMAHAASLRLDALESASIRTDEQRKAELQAIRDLTDEVRAYRQAVLDAAREAVRGGKP